MREKARDGANEVAQAATKLGELLARLKPDDPWPAEEVLPLVSNLCFNTEALSLWHRHECGQLPRFEADIFPFFKSVGVAMQAALGGLSLLVPAVAELERREAAGTSEMQEADRATLGAALDYAGTRLVRESQRALELLSRDRQPPSAARGMSAPPSVN